ncbi:equilibrative nucleoside transporter 1 isoform a [Anaeramoeba flamelloides]|uniref:Equilibrative nucleoside transporter 1 isoform a n=1 Tax=Anaeramoeba flamelloides TaxID=1746091 RepID=A0AAV7ZZW1_9EUKA|nr:equilibrative nucleoside transporter 1 isoform a [Anaeramoeba flamelloides]
METKPKDKYNLVYFFFVCLGLSHLLAYHCFVVAYDYFAPHLKSISKNFEFWFNSLLNCTACIALSFDLFFTTYLKRKRLKKGITKPKKLRYTFRIISGFVTYVICLSTPSIIIQFFPVKLAFALLMIEVTLIGCATGIVEGGIFGFAALFEPKYTTALMIGQGVAGALMVYLRIITKATTKETVAGVRKSAISYFASSSGIVACVIFAYFFILKNKFTKYYVDKYYQTHYHKNQNQKEIKEVENEIIIESDTRSEEYLQKEENSPLTDHKDLLINESESGSEDIEKKTLLSNTEFKDGKEKDIKLFDLYKRCFPYSISVFLSFTVTIAIYPAVIVEIPSTSSYLTSSGWFGIILLTAFNTIDLVGRSLPMWYPNLLSIKAITWTVCLRFVFCVYFVLCIKKIIFIDWLAIILMIVFAITNGFPSSTAMMRGPFDPKIKDHERDTVAIILTISVQAGLFAGAVSSWIFVPVIKHS